MVGKKERKKKKEGKNVWEENENIVRDSFTKKRTAK